MILAVLALAFGLLSAPGVQAEYVDLPGPVSDHDFYRAVSCGAAPGQDCKIRDRRWPPGKSQNLSVRIMQVHQDFPPELGAILDTAVDAAITEINRAAPITVGLHRDPLTPRPDIAVYIIMKSEDNRIAGTNLRGFEDQPIANARVIVRSTNARIQRAWVLLTQSLTPETAHSVVLEEMTQALGFLFDVRGPAYANQSIFDEDGSVVTRLDGQDAAVLTMKYPY